MLLKIEKQIEQHLKVYLIFVSMSFDAKLIFQQDLCKRLKNKNTTSMAYHTASTEKKQAQTLSTGPSLRLFNFYWWGRRS